MNLKNLLQTNLSLKLFSLLAGAALWYIVGSSHVSTMQCIVPVCFYGNTDHITLEAPELCTIKLAGKRADLRSLNLNDLALHICVDDLDWGNQLIEPDAQKLLLPSTIKLVQWRPSNLIVTVLNNEEQEKNS